MTRGVIVTGGSTGIGFEVARRFAASGDRVVITARSADALDEARSLLASEGLDVVTAAGSVSDLRDARRTLATAMERLGSVDVLVNNAGICHEASVIDTDDETWAALMATNVAGVFLMSREAARIMIEQGTGGVIINTSSVNSTMVEPLYVPYSATKAAVDALTKGMALELAPFGIRVVGVRPGYIETPMISKVLQDPAGADEWREAVAGVVPLGRMAYPEELAGTYFFLASEDASYITGTNVVVDGGRVASPGAQ